MHFRRINDKIIIQCSSHSQRNTWCPERNPSKTPITGKPNVSIVAPGMNYFQCRTDLVATCQYLRLSVCPYQLDVRCQSWCGYKHEWHPSHPSVLRKCWPEDGARTRSYYKHLKMEKADSILGTASEESNSNGMEQIYQHFGLESSPQDLHHDYGLKVCIMTKKWLRLS